MRSVRHSIILLIILSGCAVPAALPERITDVILGGQTVAVKEAVTPAELAQGLAGVVSLPDDKGMLFRFNDKRERSFWMKGMVISIDIIWLDGERIIGIERNVPFEEAGVLLTDLPLYTSPEPADFVLEVAAGFADRYGVGIGDTVKYR